MGDTPRPPRGDRRDPGPQCTFEGCTFINVGFTGAPELVQPDKAKPRLDLEGTALQPPSMSLTPKDAAGSSRGAGGR
jgi:hypothetical protein